MFIKEKIIANRNKNTWMLLLVIEKKVGVLELMVRFKIASIISKKEPKIKKTKGITFISKRKFIVIIRWILNCENSLKLMLKAFKFIKYAYFKMKLLLLAPLHLNTIDSRSDIEG